MASAPEKIGTFEGRDVLEAVLESETGVRIAVMNYGAVLRDWQVPVTGGVRHVVLGFDRFEHYPAHSPYFGAICGRVANRIGGARFALDGREYRLVANEGPNQLHGGPRGIGRQLWNMEVLSANAVRLRLTSPDGEMGYPGRLDIAVTYRLSGNTLRIDFCAETDKPTPVNIVQHNYFNLAGEGDVRDHRIEVNADAYTVLGEGLIPTGEIAPVTGTRYDLRTPRQLQDENGNPVDYDINLVLAEGRNLSEPVATVTAPDGSLTLRLKTDQPGLQLYTGGKMNIPVPGLAGHRYPRFGGLCLEDQNFPDAINHPHFPSSVIMPEKPYSHWCEIEIG